MAAKRFIKIPEQVAHDSRLKPITRILYGEIEGLARQYGYCFATNEFFAKEYECSVFAISRYINELVKAGLIHVATGRQRRISLTERATSFAQTVKDGCANGQASLTERASDLAQTRNHNIINKMENLKDKKKSVSKEAFGQYKNIYLSAVELQTLQNEFPATWSNWIERASVYCQQKGKKYEDYLATIRAWAEKEKQQQELEKPKFDDPVLQAMSEWEKAHTW